MPRPISLLLFLLVLSCDALRPPPFVRVELKAPPGFSSPRLDTLEVLVETEINGQEAFQTTTFDAQGLALPLSFVLEFIDPKERGLRVSLTVVGFSQGQPVLYAQGEAKARKDRLELLADFCGDGKLDDLLAEECDDGNLLSGDGCSSFCQVEDLCGNGRVDEGEECDDGNDQEGDGCDSNCTFSACGNGIQAPGEVCLTPAGSFPVGTHPSSLVAADFDGDGLPDLAIANEFSNNVTILFKDGSGLFASLLTLPLGAGANPRDIVAADFDGDGDLDLAVAASGLNQVFVFGNDLTGQSMAFLPPFPLTVGNFPISLAAEDLDGDGFPELVTANFNSRNVSVLRNRSSQALPLFFGSPNTLAPVQFSQFYSTVAIGELTQSGGPEIVAAAHFETGIRPQLGFLANPNPVGLENFQFNTLPSVDVGNNFFDVIGSIEIGDLNGDGRNDLVISHSGLNAFGVLLRQGGGIFGAENLGNNVVGEGQQKLKLVDIDGDGILDVVVLGSAIRVLLGLGDGRFAPQQVFPVGASPSNLAIADFDGDGLLDVAVTDSVSNEVLILLQTP